MACPISWARTAFSSFVESASKRPSVTRMYRNLGNIPMMPAVKRLPFEKGPLQDVADLEPLGIQKRPELCLL